MLGFATFAAAGGLAHAWQRIPWARYNPVALEWSYWLLFAGVILMVSDLTLAGLVEARLWQSAAPWLDSVRAVRPYWLVRSLSAVPIAAGFVALLVGFTTGKRGAGLEAIEQTIGLEPVVEIAPRLAAAAAAEAS
jgi:cytochrome c oxidase cbb3-type subunit 1